MMARLLLWLGLYASRLLLAGAAEAIAEDGTRRFDRSLSLESEASTSAGVSLGDIDGDRHLDILLAKGRHWPAENLVLFGDGRGGFPRREVVGAADRTYSGALADWDGDGRLDLVVSNDRPDRKYLYRNDGRGHLVQVGTFGEATWPTRYVALADLNADGRIDIVAANRNGERTRGRIPSYVCFQDGKGGFSECRPLPGESSTIIVAADFDGDRAIDLFMPPRDGGHSRLWWNDSQGGFAESFVFEAEESRTRAAVAADLDGDNRLDLATAGADGQGVIAYRNCGMRRFEPARRVGAAGRSVYALAIADMDLDQRADIVVGYDQGRGSVFFGEVGGGFREVEWNDGRGAVYGLAIGDLNGDHWPDIVTARSGAVNAVWFSQPVSASRE
jgi:hypothetical protein